MKKLLVLLTILSSIIAYAEDTIELDQTTVKGSKTSDYRRQIGRASCRERV